VHRPTYRRRRATTTPLAPAPVETRREEPAKPATTAKPMIAPEAARAQAEPEPVAKVAPAPEPVTRPVAAPVPERVTRPVAAPASIVTPAPERVARPAAVAAAPNAASEADIGNQLREIVTSKQFDRVIARKPERDAIVALHQKSRSFQPLWVSQGAPSARAQDVLNYLRTIDADGLDPKDYPMPKLNVGSAEAQAEAELKFTETLLTYARHAMTGRVHFSRVSPNIEYKLAFDAEQTHRRHAQRIGTVRRPRRKHPAPFRRPSRRQDQRPPRVVAMKPPQQPHAVEPSAFNSAKPFICGP